MAVSADPTDPNFGLETDQSSPNFGLATESPKQDTGLESGIVEAFQKAEKVIAPLQEGVMALYRPPGDTINRLIFPEQHKWETQPLISPEVVQPIRKALQYPIQTLNQIVTGQEFKEPFPQLGELASRLISGQTSPENLALIAATGIAAKSGTLPTLRETALGEKPAAPEAMPQTPEPLVAETVPPITEIKPEEVTQNAVQEQSPSSVLPHPQEGVTETGGERVGVGPSFQGEAPAEALPQTQEVAPPVPQPEQATQIGNYEHKDAVVLEDFQGTSQGLPVTFSADYDPHTNRVLLSGEWGNELGNPREVTPVQAREIAKNVPFNDALNEALDKIPPVPESQLPTTAEPSPKTETGAAVPPEQPTVDALARNLADELGGEVVGSAAKLESKPNDIDIRLTESQIPGAIKKLKQKGYEQLDSGVVSPEEAKKSGKIFGEGWSRNWNLKNPETGQKVQLWHQDEGKLVPEPSPVSQPTETTTAEPLPQTPSEPPPVTPETPEAPKTGVSSERFTEQYGEDAPVPNTGRNAGELKAIGQSRLDNFQKTGDIKNDPYSVLTNLREGKVPVSKLADDVSLLRAEHQRLKNDAIASEGTPEWEAKSQASLDMAQAIKEVAHGPASDMMRSFQEYDKPRYDNVTDFDQALRERLGRESTSQERVKFKEMADDVTNTRNGAQEAINGAQKKLSKMPKMNFEDAYKSIHDQIAELTKDCVL